MQLIAFITYMGNCAT